MTSSRPLGKYTDVEPNEVITAGYSVLAAAQLALALPAITKPHDSVEWMLGATALPHVDVHEALVRCLGANLLAAAATSAALAEANRAGLDGSDTSVRLKLGLAVENAVKLALLFVHREDHTSKGLAAAGSVLGAGLLLPGLQLLANEKERNKLGDLIKGVGSGLGKLFSIPKDSKPSSLLHSILTPAFLLTGGWFLGAPRRSVQLVLDVARRVDTLIMWKNIGAGLLGLFPAMTFTLKTKADRGLQGSGVARILNAGLAASSLAHLMVDGPLLYNDEGGKALPLVVGIWAVGLLAGAAGLSEGGNK